MTITDDTLKNKDEIQDVVECSNVNYEEEEDDDEDYAGEEEEEDVDDDCTSEETDEETLDISCDEWAVWEPYSAAAKRNALRRKLQIRSGEYIPEEHDPLKSSIHVPKVLTKEELEAKKMRALDLAIEISACAIKIQEAIYVKPDQELDEATVMKEIGSFIDMPVTPLSITYSPIMMLTLKLCMTFVEHPAVQLAAKSGYDKCSVLFPFHITSSFEAVYIATVKKVVTEEEFGADLMGDIVEQLEEVLFTPDPLDDYDDSVLLEDWI